MVGNTFSNINKTNNYLSPQTITSHLKQLPLTSNNYLSPQAITSHLKQLPLTSNNYLSPQAITSRLKQLPLTSNNWIHNRSRYISLELPVLARDRHNNMVGAKPLNGILPSNTCNSNGNIDVDTQLNNLLKIY
jgi:hypothetical protein